MSRRPYIRELSRSGWWLQQPRYIRYMLREISALFIGLYVLVLMVGLFQISRGESAYENYRVVVEGTGGLVLAIVAFVFAMYHTYTWFQVTPKAMPLMLGAKRIPGVVIIAAHWFGFVLVSAVCWLLVS